MIHSEERILNIKEDFPQLSQKLCQYTHGDFGQELSLHWALNSVDPWLSRLFLDQATLLENQAVLDYLKDFSKAHKVPYYISLWDSGELGKEALRKLGYQEFYNQRAMHCSLLELPAQKLSDGASIVPIRSWNQLAEWSSVLQRVFGNGKDLNLYKQLMARDDLELLGLELQGSLVSTALVQSCKKTAGIHMVATLEEHRGKGLGRDITLATMLWARAQDCNQAVLQASPMGESLYEALGFQGLGSISHWEKT